MSQRATRITLIAVVMLVIALGPALLAQSAKPGSTNCSDLSVSFAFLSTTVAPAAIWNDIASPYQNGVDGVSNTVIHRCYVTNDATMLLTHSKRFVWMQVPAPLAGSIILPRRLTLCAGPRRSLLPGHESAGGGVVGESAFHTAAQPHPALVPEQHREVAD